MGIPNDGCTSSRRVYGVEARGLNGGWREATSGRRWMMLATLGLIRAPALQEILLLHATLAALHRNAFEAALPCLQLLEIFCTIMGETDPLL